VARTTGIVELGGPLRDSATHEVRVGIESKNKTRSVCGKSEVRNEFGLSLAIWGRSTLSVNFRRVNKTSGVGQARLGTAVR
jgi:hypothetical protein